MLIKSAINIDCQLSLLVSYLLETSYDVAQCYTVQECDARNVEDCYVAGSKTKILSLFSTPKNKGNVSLEKDLFLFGINELGNF